MPVANTFTTMQPDLQDAYGKQGKKLRFGKIKDMFKKSKDKKIYPQSSG